MGEPPYRHLHDQAEGQHEGSAERQSGAAAVGIVPADVGLLGVARVGILPPVAPADRHAAVGLLQLGVASLEVGLAGAQAGGRRAGGFLAIETGSAVRVARNTAPPSREAIGVAASGSAVTTRASDAAASLQPYLPRG